MPDRTHQIAHADPWDAIIAGLTAPAAEQQKPATTPREPRPTPVISRGHPFTARPDSIRCLKQRAIAHRRLYMVSFEDQQPAAPRWQWLIGVDESDAGWITGGGAGGSGQAPQRDRPWVNLAGWWGADRFCAGGEVLSGQHISRVRLTARDGTTLQDDTEEDVVLFLTDHSIELPVTLELLDETGQVLASQLALDVPR